jgi:D-alanyl-D-alanine carboxypeptidase
LSGIVKDRYAFSILQNGYPVATWSARRSQDRFAAILAAS